ncbi:hypothetical protein VTJ49DRAFT_3277 [Mycothermus thermophilus]|uniref:Gamma-butyrobetaine dioxygenase n=1 Tax=Humicola insolens TaxID=85995 RepID=A0ABR3V820_HUMIN
MTRALRAARPVALAASRCTSTVTPIRSLCLLQQRLATTRTKPVSSPAALSRQFGTTAARAQTQDTETATEEEEEPDVLPSPKELATLDQTPQDPNKRFKYRFRTSAGVVSWDRSYLRFRYAKELWDDHFTLSTLWLRDACECPRCVDRHSGQKTFSTTDLPDVPTIKHAMIRYDKALELTFANDKPSGGGDHTVLYSAKTLAEWRAVGSRWHRFAFTLRKPDIIPWDRASYEALLADGRCRVSYNDWINNEPAFFDALRDLSQTGLIFVTDVPQDEKSVEQIATRIGPLMHTFYGWTWDVRSKPQAENVAYTNVFLGLHQDLMYHDPIPGLQLLHCLANDCSGGESLFSHGLRAAYELKLTHQKDFDNLCRHKTWFGYRRNGHHHFARHSTIVAGFSQHPTEVCWAPPFQTTFPLAVDHRQTDNLRRWRDAAQKFQQIAESELNTFELKLKPGECVIFDNRRVLHGRREFDAGNTGSRWLKGAYVAKAVYHAAQTRMIEYMQEMGMALPPTKGSGERAQKFVEEALAARKAAAKKGGGG